MAHDPRAILDAWLANASEGRPYRHDLPERSHELPDGDGPGTYGETRRGTVVSSVPLTAAQLEAVADAVWRVPMAFDGASCLYGLGPSAFRHLHDAEFLRWEPCDVAAVADDGAYVLALLVDSARPAD